MTLATDPLEQQLIDHEAIRLKPYLDCCGRDWRTCQCAPKGNLTIGIGRNLDAVGISAAEALILERNDILQAKASLDAELPWWRQQDEIRQRVLIDLCFNMGIAVLVTFDHTLSLIEAGDYPEAADALKQTLWFRQVKARGVRLVRMLRTGHEVSYADAMKGDA